MKFADNPPLVVSIVTSIVKVVLGIIYILAVLPWVIDLFITIGNLVALQGDREIVREAVTQNGRALQYASEALKGDREIVREAVTQNGLRFNMLQTILKKIVYLSLMR